MKTNNAKLIALLMLVSFACKDDDEATVPIDNEEAAEMIATSLSSESGGLTVAVADAASNTTENGGGRKATCGYTESMDASRSNPTGSSVIYNYTFHYDYALNCTNALPTEMVVNLTYSGSLDAPRISTQNSGTGNLSVKALDYTYENYSITGSYDRTGSFVSKVRDKNTSNSTLDFTLTDVTVDKSTRQITGGTATVTITGSVTGKGTFTFTGSLVFEGDQSATLDLNGTNYSIDLETGLVAAI